MRFVVPQAEVRAMRFVAWRLVEAQHQLATAKLVDTAEEQELLERLIDAAKPPLPDTPEFAGLHFLLAAPFRYPPLRHGSRFGSIGERGLWYGARVLEAALAEVAFYRLLFLAGTAAELDVLETTHTAYAARVVARRAVDVARPAFDGVRDAVCSPLGHAAGRVLGGSLRALDVEVVVFPSARDPAHRTAVAVFTPRVFTRRSPEPESAQTWFCTTRSGSVAFHRVAFAREPALVFARAAFEIDGVLPEPG